LQPQQLYAAAYLFKVDEFTGQQNNEILYVDGQFDLFAVAEVLDGYNTKPNKLEELTVFNYEQDRKEFISEIGRFGTRINDDYQVDPSNRLISATAEGDYQGVIIAEVTKDKSTASSVTWTRILPSNGSTDWDTRLVDAVNYTGDWRFIRFRFGGQGKGKGASFHVTTSDDMYTSVSVIHRGQDYKVGDMLLIPGSRLGGNDGVNDLTVIVQSVNQYPPGSINTVMGVTWSGIAAGTDVQYYRNVQAENIASTNVVKLIRIDNNPNNLPLW